MCSTMTMGTLVVIPLVYLCSYVKSPTAFVFIYGVSFGIGKGFMTSASLNAAWSHLPGRKGIATGLVLSGLGFGGFIFGILSTLLINPKNVKALPSIKSEQVTEYFFPESIAAGVPRMMRSLVLIWACMLLFSIIAVSEFKKVVVSLDD